MNDSYEPREPDGSTTPEVVRSYLSELDGAMVGIPEDTRRDILGAISEELYGLDAEAATRRIRRLGDPQFIAAEARAAGSVAADGTDAAAAATSGPTPQTVVESAGIHPSTSPRPASAAPGEPHWYPVVAVLVLIFIPIVGLIIGYGMIWFSRAWTRAEKVIATVIPIAAAAVVITGGAIAEALNGTPAEGGDSITPAFPGNLSLWHTGVLVVAIIPVCVGLWLLVRWRRRVNGEAQKSATTSEQYTGR